MKLHKSIFVLSVPMLALFAFTANADGVGNAYPPAATTAAAVETAIPEHCASMMTQHVAMMAEHAKLMRGSDAKTTEPASPVAPGHRHGNAPRWTR